MRPEHWRFTIPLRLRSLFRWAQADQELDDELQDHIELKTAQYLANGVPMGEARRQALLEMGGLEKRKEECREARRVSWIHDVAQDLKFGLRMLRKSPGFTAVAVFTLAFGIGTNTAIFSMVNGVLLRALPYTEPSQLYAIHEVVPQWISSDPSLAVNGGNFLAWKKDSHAFSAMTLLDSTDGSLLGMGHPQWLYGAAVTSDFFSTLGAQLQMGRAFLAGDGAVSRPEIILTNKLWREQFHSDPDILGKIVNLGGRGVTVVGVLRANFIFPQILAHEPEYLRPFVWSEWNSRPGIGMHNHFVIARLKGSVTPREAEAQLDVIEARIAQKDRGGKFGLYAVLTPLKTEIVGPTQKALWMLTMAAGLVLLIVCANMGNLLLVKNSRRVREVALRSALGAGYWRLARQFLAETLILALAGGCLGLILAQVGLSLLVRNAPIGIPRVDQIRLDSTVLWFTVAVTMLAALVFGLLPALRATKAEALKSSGPMLSVSRQGARLRTGLVIGEIALCAAILPLCLLLIESLRHVVLANQWMNEEHVITADLVVHVQAPQIQTPQDMRRVFDESNRIFTSIEEKVRQLPGVESAGLTSAVPLEGEGWGDAINFQEIPLPETELPSGQFRFVSPGYFHAIGLSLIKGRLFSQDDFRQSVAVVSESVARKLLGGRDPLGMRVFCGNFSFEAEKWCRVVGEVADVRAQSDQAPLLAVYFPLWLYSEDMETLVVRTKMDPTSAASAIREVAWSVDPQLAIPQEKTLKTVLASSEAPRRYETSLVTLFALSAVLLTMLGLYAVISHSVSHRTHEIGTRMALGARQGDVLRMVAREGAVLAGLGTLAGLGGALALTRFLRGLLFEIQPTDPATFVAVAILLTLVALLACYIPARRAMRVDPMVALRYE
jgi:putative ABC transport system permease protein